MLSHQRRCSILHSVMLNLEGARVGVLPCGSAPSNFLANSQDIIDSAGANRPHYPYDQYHRCCLLIIWARVGVTQRLQCAIFVDFKNLLTMSGIFSGFSGRKYVRLRELEGLVPCVVTHVWKSFWSQYNLNFPLVHLDVQESFFSFIFALLLTARTNTVLNTTAPSNRLKYVFSFVTWTRSLFWVKMLLLKWLMDLALIWLSGDLLVWKKVRILSCRLAKNYKVLDSKLWDYDFRRCFVDGYRSSAPLCDVQSYILAHHIQCILYLLNVGCRHSVAVVEIVRRCYPRPLRHILN